MRDPSRAPFLLTLLRVQLGTCIGLVIDPVADSYTISHATSTGFLFFSRHPLPEYARMAYDSGDYTILATLHRLAAPSIYAHTIAQLAAYHGGARSPSTDEVKRRYLAHGFDVGAWYG